jgi:aspartate racemase
MKVLGIIGGIAPESTIAYYRAIIAEYRARVTDGGYPPVIINSIDLTTMLALAATDQRRLAIYLLGEIQRLADAGAQFALMASNTPHLVFDEVRAQSSLPLVSIVESARDAAKERRFRRVGLFGTRLTMEAEFYPRVFATAGIDIITPDPEDQAYIHEKYMEELVNAIFLPETRDRLLALIDRLRMQEQIEAVILGGTELPLILKGNTAAGIPVLDTTAIHVKRAVTEMLSQSANC